MRMRFNKRTRAKRGVVVLELILSLPLLFISLVAIVQFGTLMANLQAVAVASREGGRIAARDIPLNQDTADDIRIQVDRILQSAGFGADASQGVVLVHNIGSFETLVSGDCPPPAAPPLPPQSVRVRVCVPLERLAPDLLAPLGFTLTAFTVEQDATFDYEL